MDILRAATLLIASACALAAVLSLGGAFSEDLDVLSHFAPLYGLGGGAAALTALAMGSRDRATLIAAGVAILASGALLLPEVFAGRRTSSASPTDHTLKLIQFNLWTHNFDPARTARWVIAEKPDIVVVEEAVGGGAEVVRALRATFPFESPCPPDNDCSSRILSRRAPVASGPLRGIDTRNFSGAWATFGEGSNRFTVVGVHLTWPIPAGPQQAQSRRLTQALERFDARALILSGDFNSTPWSFAMRHQDGRLGLNRLTRALFSWPAAGRTRWRLSSPLPFLPIDHVYAGSDWRPTGVRRGPRLGSDHFPVVVELARTDAPDPPADTDAKRPLAPTPAPSY